MLLSSVYLHRDKYFMSSKGFTYTATSCTGSSTDVDEQSSSSTVVRPFLEVVTTFLASFVCFFINFEEC